MRPHCGNSVSAWEYKLLVWPITLQPHRQNSRLIQEFGEVLQFSCLCVFRLESNTVECSSINALNLHTCTFRNMPCLGPGPGLCLAGCWAGPGQALAASQGFWFRAANFGWQTCMYKIRLRLQQARHNLQCSTPNC